MPLFLSDEEFERFSNDAALLAEKADSFIKDLHCQLETVKAQADAASITAKQTCSLLEQKYISLSSDFAKLESQNAQLNATLEQLISELAEVQSEKHQLHLKAIGRDGEMERLSIEVSELHKSKRQLLELVEQKDLEITEKNATIKTYLDKIVNLTDNGALREDRLHDIEAEMARSNAALARFSQEKKLIERHSVWLNDELTAKVGSLVELRRSHTELEADMSANLANIQREFDECSRSLNWNKERVRELENNLTSMQEELCSFKDDAAANEERYSAEISTDNLVIMICPLASTFQEVRVRLVGFGAEEDEWVSIKNVVRERSIPMEPSECQKVEVGDLVLCFQERRDQAIYYDAHVVEIKRRLHDIRGCRCLFLVLYDHDNTEQHVMSGGNFQLQNLTPQVLEHAQNRGMGVFGQLIQVQTSPQQPASNSYGNAYQLGVCPTESV